MADLTGRRQAGGFGHVAEGGRVGCRSWRRNKSRSLDGRWDDGLWSNWLSGDDDVRSRDGGVRRFRIVV
ncbi:hypothetical protein GCM10017620_08030 [Brevundimonas intermedia]|uniref:Uncharacterized protein n=1 Tax=Brevundimonas intermedia TaxID=74315 RepID=A0ABQ5T4Z3_9CAUL|nr:hypothetical protein GCM10017620_08030 [Brevundimonas intermedia]